uniref:Small cysteine-rich protein SCR91 n=1 Tax=Phytophthora infestans TaxID=4787 RepID=Q2M443_PHYIN|nr:small cysteine-rich protein SCR91 [Phytophthora infestans]
MKFKIHTFVALFGVVATAVTAGDPFYKPPPYCNFSTGCQTLYSEANLAVSKECRDEGNSGDDFHTCCINKCGSTAAPISTNVEQDTKMHLS